MVTLITMKPPQDNGWAAPANGLETAIAAQFRTLSYSRLEIGRYTLEKLPLET